MKPIKIFIIAGEESGDKLGSKLMRELKLQSHGKVKFAGVGGESMKQEGLDSLFPMSQISLMGFWEIIPHIVKLAMLVKNTINAILDFNPDIVVTIDSPGFAMQVVKKVRSKINAKFIHYVAPSVWAYKPERARKMQPYYDLVLALLPFEPPYFEKVGLACKFVGHPIIEDGLGQKTSSQFKKKYDIKTDNMVIGVMCGSRQGEIKTLLPIIKDTISILAPQLKQQVTWIFPTVSTNLATEIESILKPLNINIRVPIREQDKIGMFKSMDYAIVKSGTSSLELALAEIPMLVTYKINNISAWILRHIYKFSNFASIVNILAKKEVIPEYLQEKCAPPILASAMLELINDGGKNQVKECNKILKSLHSPTKFSPSHEAADSILKLLN